MLEQVLRHLKNWFVVKDGAHYGTFCVEGGNIELPFLLNGQYFRVVGSVFNDGVYRYGDPLVLQDEVFSGVVYALAVPVAVVKLAQDIKEWSDKNAAVLTGPYQSESFGGYSYTLKSTGGDDGVASWQSTFAGRLNQWRKL